MRNIGMSANRAGPGRNSAGFRGTVVSTTQSIKWRKPSFLGQDSLDERDSEPLGEDDNVDIDNDVFEVMYRETFRDIKVTSRTPSRNGSTARSVSRDPVSAPASTIVGRAPTRSSQYTVDAINQGLSLNTSRKAQTSATSSSFLQSRDVFQPHLLETVPGKVFSRDAGV